MQLYNESKQAIILEKLTIADSFFKRLIGLLGKKEISADEGIFINPCKSIHTFFMKFPIDVVFLDKSQKVIFIQECIQPNKVTPFIKKSKTVIEMKGNKIKKDGIISMGDYLKITKG